jgi:hypothetical protein
MSGLFRRLSSRRSGGPEGDQPLPAAEPGATDTPTSAPAEAGGQPSLLNDPAAPTRVIPEAAPPAADPPKRRADTPAAIAPHPAVAPAPYGPQPAPVVPVADLPAGVDPDELTAAPGTTARRGKLRRRVAFLRAARELLLRDLGGFVYELHRTAGDVEATAHRQLREIKLNRLTQVDAELHALEMRLDDVRRQVLVREPGVGGECPECGELFGSAAHYCSHCGLPLTESARRAAARARQPEGQANPVVAEPPKDQPTEEISPLDPDHPSAGAEFTWPRRDSAPEAPTSWAAAPAAGGAAAGEAAPSGAEAGEAGPSDAGPSDATTEVPAGEAASSDAADAPTGEAGPSDADQAGDAPEGEAEPREAAGEAPDAAGDAAPREAAGAPTGETAPSDASQAAGEAEPAAAGEAAPSEAQDAPAGEGVSREVQENGSVFTPVERRP